MNRYRSVGVMWLVAAVILMAGGCGQKKPAEIAAPQAPAPQPGVIPVPEQPAAEVPAQPTATAESRDAETPAAAEPAAAAVQEPPETPRPSAQPSVPPPAKPAAKPAPPASGQKPSPASSGQAGKPAAPTKRPQSAPEAASSAAPKPAVPAPEPTKAKPKGTVVLGTIQIVSDVPDPSTVPYDTCVTFIKYRVSKVLSGSYDGDELLAVFWGMKAGKLQPAARFTTGQTHRLTIEPFDNQKDLARVMQADDTNEYSLTPYWVISYSAE